MAGFFASNLKQPPKLPGLVPACGACGLYKTCISPKMPVTGDGNQGILIVAEAPGEDEDEQNIQLIGKAGQFLRKKIRQLGYDLDRVCWKTNSLICRPPKNRAPTKDEIEFCRPNLIQAMKELKPRVIIPLGGSAVESVIGHLWKEDTGGIGRWSGFQIPCQRPNVWICPTYHPSYLLREEDDVLELWFERHLESAFNIVGRPWQEKPNWDSEVRVTMDDERAAKTIRKIASMEIGAVAFDYETTTLKPDPPWAEIVSCAVTWGVLEPKITVAFPWRGDAKVAMGELLRSPIPKIAANMKFEDRWSRKEYGHRVRNWVHDTMLMAHIMDNRPGICSLKFQSFVHLGYPEYAGRSVEFFDAGNARDLNRIRQLDLNQLMFYNGLDAMLEFRLAVRQLQMMGFDYPWRTK